MLHYNFHNFEGFQGLFGIQHHGNGVKSRKNKILLSYIKNRQLLHNASVTSDYHLLHISDMAGLKQTMIAEIKRSGEHDISLPHIVKIKDTLIIAHSITRTKTTVCVKTVTSTPYAM